MWQYEYCCWYLFFAEYAAANSCPKANVCSLQVVSEDLSMVELTSPYIPGFLAFREAGFLAEKLEKLRREKPRIMPQAVLVDGNGILHPKSVCEVYCSLL